MRLKGGWSIVGDGHSPVDIDFETTVILIRHLALPPSYESPASFHSCPGFGLRRGNPAHLLLRPGALRL